MEKNYKIEKNQLDKLLNQLDQITNLAKLPT